MSPDVANILDGGRFSPIMGYSEADLEQKFEHLSLVQVFVTHFPLLRNNISHCHCCRGEKVNVTSTIVVSVSAIFFSQ